MTPLRRMTKSRDAWKEKSTARATEIREQRKRFLAERARRKAAEKELTELKTELRSPPF